MTFEVGKFYRVPCLLTKNRLADGWSTLWNGEWIPVIGPLHRDDGPVEFPWLHWHVDLRFVSDRVFKEMEIGAPATKSPYAMPLQKHPLGWSPTNWRGEEKTGDSFVEGETIMKLRKCRRAFPAYPSRHAFWLPKLHEEFKDVRLKGMVCPHRGIPLDGCPRKGDVVTCPGHGLRWNVKTGALVRQTQTEPQHRQSEEK